ncbi:MAG: aspartate carbamoyltransferase regulatory subunit, partial [Clostridia bacterium]|nr:aspartate carbamoyltransferase regulatory subunit [Clostridia bacterium]
MGYLLLGGGDAARVLALDDVHHTFGKLHKLKCSVAVLTNVPSRKMGRKDIIKIGELIELDLDVLGYIDPGITV